MDAQIIAPEQIPAWEQAIDSAFRIISTYGWYFAAALGAPLAVFIGIQWGKNLWRKLTAFIFGPPGTKPHWAVLDVGSWAATFWLSTHFWHYAGGNHEAGLWVALIVASFQTAIVKFIFRKAPREVARVLADGIYMTDEEAKTIMGFTKMAVFGGRKSDRRSRERDEHEPDESTRVLTEAERREITDPKRR